MGIRNEAARALVLFAGLRDDRTPADPERSTLGYLGAAPKSFASDTRHERHH